MARQVLTTQRTKTPPDVVVASANHRARKSMRCAASTPKRLKCQSGHGLSAKWSVSSLDSGICASLMPAKHPKSYYRRDDPSPSERYLPMSP